MPKFHLPIVTRIIAVSGISLGIFATALLAVVRRTVERAVYAETDARVEVAQKTLFDLIARKGVASIQDGRLELGRWIANDDHSLVDHLKHLTGADATLFQMDGTTPVRVTTTVMQAGTGRRNVGTELLGPARAAIDRDQSFAGVNPIAGCDFIVRYDPLRDAQGHVVGVVYCGVPLASMQAATRSTMSIVLTGTPIALLVSLSVLYLITRPVRQTIQSAVHVAQRLALGDVDQSAGRISNDEIGEVNIAFADMIAYQRRMASVADAISRGDLSVDISPASKADRLGIAFVRMTRNLRDIVKQLEVTASTDTLTKLSNRRAFDEQLKMELSRCARHGETMALALIDVDDFKLINDERGHLSGDEALTNLAAILGKVRLEDRSFRIGGDEFALILPHTTEAEAHVLLERIRASVEAQLDGTTISVGIATASLGPFDSEELYRRADAALYAGKARGKNTVAVAAGASPATERED